MVLGLAQGLNPLSVGGGGGIHMQAHLRGADKGNAPDVGMSQQDLRLMAGAGHDVEHAVGDTGLPVKRRELHAGHGRGGGGLQDEGIAADDGKGRHPAHGDHGREIPGRNSGKHADGFPVEGGVIAPGGIHQAFAHQQAGRRAGKLGHLQSLRHVTGSLAPTLSVFGSDHPGQFFLIPLNEAPQLHHNTGAGTNGGILPGGEGCLCGGNGLFYLSGGALGDLGNGFAGGGIIDGGELLAFAVDPLTADIGLHHR